jgi:hypothetical protein
MSDGQVFVTRGNVTRIECDAWMVPTDRRYSIRPSWREHVPEFTDELIERSQTDEFTAGVSKATPVIDYPKDLPLPILTAVPERSPETADYLRELRDAISQFIEIAARETPDLSRRNRAKRLFVMPAFGADGGGGSLKKGELLQAYLHEARAGVQRYDVDVAIVLKDERLFALAQQLRKATDGQWSALTAAQRSTAERLAVLARRGRLVPFMGAGVSVGAGAPTWRELIGRLAAGVDMDEEEVESLEFEGRSALDQASYLRELYRRRSGDGRAFWEAVVRAVTTDRYGLTPALLASLRTEQAITLNFDTQFEDASADIDDIRTIIPADGTSRGETDKWLLKLHGSIRDPDTIVLTRDDYLGYSANREALSGIVKANLITHHLLFVGFGLTDDHFHQIIHDVRRAIPNSGKEKFGTALTLAVDKLDETLWADQLEIIVMSAAGGIPDRSRQLEIFLDALLAYSTDGHSYLLDSGFTSSLTDEQSRLRAKVLSFEDELGDEFVHDPSWPVIEHMFRELGGSN